MAENQKKEFTDDEINLLQNKLAEMKTDSVPYLINGKFDEYRFCEYFLTLHKLICVNDMFYDLNGPVEESKVTSEIFEMLDGKIRNKVAAKCTALTKALKMKTREDEFRLQTDRIHFANGTYYLDEDRFSEEKEFCLNRLPINYNRDYMMPEKFLIFLNDLLEKEDIFTLQEFMGYCMIPTTIAQTMLIIIGKGGEGKSQVGAALRAVLGNNMNTSSLKKLTTSKFAKADQEGKLLMLDDDMSMDAMPDTDILKSLITSDGKSESEKKGKQSTQVNFYVRLMAFSNSPMTALHDKSDGFYRRQIILKAKEKSEIRADDRFLGEKIKAEAEGIAVWMIEGLKRLRANKFEFTVSDKAEALKEETREEDNNIIAFLKDEEYVRIEYDQSESSRDLYDSYKMWCEENLEKPRAVSTFSQYLRANEKALGIIYDRRTPVALNKSARGYHNIHLLRKADHTDF